MVLTRNSAKIVQKSAPTPSSPDVVPDPLLEHTFGAKCASNLPISNARWPRFLPLLAPTSGANCASNLQVSTALWPRFRPLLEPTFGAKCASNLQVSNALWARFVPLLEPTFGAKCASNLPISNARWPRLLQRGASKCTPHRLGLPSPCRDALTLISAFSKRHSLGTKRVLLTRAEGPSNNKQENLENLARNIQTDSVIGLRPKVN